MPYANVSAQYVTIYMHSIWMFIIIQTKPVAGYTCEYYYHFLILIFAPSYCFVILITVTTITR